MDNFFELLGLDNPIKEKEEKVKSKAVKKKTEKKAAKSTKKIPLPVDVTIPYCQKISGFTIEGLSEASLEEIKKELQKRYPHLIKVGITHNKDGIHIFYHSYGDVAKGEIKCSSFLFGSENISFESEGENVDCTVLKDAFYASCEDYKGCDISFLADEGIVVPIFKPMSFTKEIKQEKITVIIPGVTSIDVDAVGGKITPAVIEEKVGKSYGYLKACVYKHDDKSWRIIMVSPVSANNASSAPVGFDISSGKVQVSLLWRKIELKPEYFGGKTELTSAQICDFLVENGYPEYDKKRCTIEKIEPDLLIANIKSSTKGGKC